MLQDRDSLKYKNQKNLPTTAKSWLLTLVDSISSHRTFAKTVLDFQWDIAGVFKKQDKCLQQSDSVHGTESDYHKLIHVFDGQETETYEVNYDDKVCQQKHIFFGGKGKK